MAFRSEPAKASACQENLSFNRLFPTSDVSSPSYVHTESIKYSMNYVITLKTYNTSRTVVDLGSC